MAITLPPAPLPAARLRRLLVQRPLVAYFTLALAGTWLTLLPLLLGQDGLGLLAVRFGDAAILLALLSTFSGPGLAAYLVTISTDGRAGVHALLRRYLQWRVGLIWYLVALGGFLSIWLAGESLWLNGAPLIALIAHPSVLVSAYLLPLPLFLLLALGEETGWRGVALPRLQQAYGPCAGTLILALLHGLWHIPALLVPGFVSGSSFSVPFMVGWIATVIAATFLYSWIFNHTQGSLLIASLVHGGANASSTLLTVLETGHPAVSGWQAVIYQSPWNLANLIPFAVAAAVVIGVTRGGLGYRADQPPALGGTFGRPAGQA